MSEAALSAGPQDAERRLGFMAAAGAYTFWGFLPLYLHLLSFADVREVLAQRILWCAPAALVAVFVMSGGLHNGLREMGAALKPRMLAMLAASAFVIFFNWGIYVWLVMSHRVIESSLAYFLAPLVAVAAGVIFFRERITAAQIGALTLAAVGIIAQGLALGAPPWMALALCGTWSAYAIIRKQVAAPAAVGLLIETLTLAPLAAGLLWWAGHSAPLAFGSNAAHALLLAIAGPATALPLMAFTFGARRVSFVALGLLQFLAPSLQFATAIAFGEPFTALRAASFALIWVGLALFSWDTIRRARMK
jgi:chloramphenicol-sensitive protein RarD